MLGNLVEEQYKRTAKKGLLTTQRPKKIWYRNENKFVFVFITILGCSDRRLFYSEWRPGSLMSASIMNIRFSTDEEFLHVWQGSFNSKHYRFKTKDVKIEYYVGPIPF